MKIKTLLILLIFFPLVGCDRYTKDQAVSLLKGQEPLSFLNGFFSLTYHENTGGMLSLGAELSDEVRVILFTFLVGLVLVGGLIYMLVKPMDKYSFTVGLLILAGGFGNLYDRAVNDGRVVDFMLLQMGPLKTGVFNVADIAIMAGLFGFLFVSSKWGQRLRSS
ncbi:signal peptidase II [Cellvibrio fibrivorans]|uniref:Lipoprotein signal peptidase n=1 Tax=Cellvibrio fibrivorans TaxID=126350 RepID=A0ABU1UT22_9GAMM|nr:signal peptidase II [Cellvibrio fibrivorans]MDR7088334.1 signal peptidase II [Cellvibrio fibrivorans]